MKEEDTWGATPISHRPVGSGYNADDLEWIRYIFFECIRAPGGLDLLSNVANLKATEADLSSFVDAIRLDVVPLESLGHRAGEIDAQPSPSPELLRACLSDDPEIEKRAFQSDARWARSWAEIGSAFEMRGYPRATNAFQLGSLACGTIAAVCPYTGILLKSQISFPVFHNGPLSVVYLFESICPFYVCTGGWAGCKWFVYLPKQGVIVDALIGRGLAWHKADSIVRILLASLAKYPELLRSYLRHPKTNWASYGTIANLGHFLWNEYCGLSRIISGDVAQGLDGIFVGSHPFVSIEGHFPELRHLRVEPIENHERLYEFCLRERIFLARPTTTYVDEASAGRLLRQARLVLSEDIRSSIESYCAEHAVVFFNIRAHNKRWIEQVDGIANTIIYLREIYPNVAGVLDGLVDCKEMAEEIQHRVAERVPVRSAIGVSLEETAVWASAVKAFACTIGSGLALLTWFGEKPGVAYGDRMHLVQNAWWPEVRALRRPTVFISENQIYQQLDSNYADFSMDWRLVAHHLAGMLREEDNP